MIYAGFWKRFLAGFIDFIVAIPFIYIFLWIDYQSKTMALIFLLPQTFYYFLYQFYFLGRWGKTLGKMAVKIRVVSLDGAPISWRQAFLRNSVDLFFVILGAITSLIMYLNMPASEFHIKSFVEFSELTVKYGPKWGTWLSFMAAAWTYSELIVLLFNKKRRALHDFIAGTVVVHEESLNNKSDHITP